MFIKKILPILLSIIIMPFTACQVAEGPETSQTQGESDNPEAKKLETHQIHGEYDGIDFDAGAYFKEAEKKGMKTSIDNDDDNIFDWIRFYFIKDPNGNSRISIYEYETSEAAKKSFELDLTYLAIAGVYAYGMVVRIDRYIVETPEVEKSYSLMIDLMKYLNIPVGSQYELNEISSKKQKNVVLSPEKILQNLKDNGYPQVYSSIGEGDDLGYDIYGLYSKLGDRNLSLVLMKGEEWREMFLSSVDTWSNYDIVPHTRVIYSISGDTFIALIGTSTDVDEIWEKVTKE